MAAIESGAGARVVHDAGFGRASELNSRAREIPVKNCTSCGAALPISSVSEQVGAARCPSCRTLVDLGAPRAPVSAKALAVPERWVVDAQPGATEIRWRWFNASVFFLVPFTVIWNLFMVGFGAASSQSIENPLMLLAGLAIPHVWVGLGLAYYCLALFANTTRVRLAEGQLTVRHGPLWWPGQRTLDARDFQQLFVVEHIGNKGSRSYEVCALKRDGHRVSIVKPGGAQEARFLEARLEQSLGLADQGIDGEYRP